MKAFWKKKNTKVDTSNLELILLEIEAKLNLLVQEQRKLARSYDRINDTIAEHFEETTDLGEISQSDV